MTREEAISRIENHIRIHSKQEPFRACHIQEALKMAIEALKAQEPFIDWLTQERDKRMVAAAAHPKYSSDNMDVLHSINVVLDLYNSTK